MGKITLVCFYNVKGIINYEYVPSKQSTKHSTLKFWNVYSSTFADRDQIFG
jgi:hypothetical protein